MILASTLKCLYEGPHFLCWLWGAIMPDEYGDERMVITFSSDDPIELDKLGESFGGLARQYRRHLQSEDIDPDAVPAKLFVTSAKSGSIEFEVAPLLSLYRSLTSAVDGIVIWSDFFERVQNTLGYLSGSKSRPSGYNREDARDFDAFLNVVAGKRGGRLSAKRAKFHQKTGQRELLAEFDFTEQDVANAHMQLAKDLTENRETPEAVHPDTHEVEMNVPFIWFRTDRERGRSSGQTSDRGVVAKITDKPLPVFFASEMENQKDQMIKTKNNPFALVYIVDVSVSYDEEKDPKRYTIMNIHQVIDGDSSVIPNPD